MAVSIAKAKPSNTIRLRLPPKRGQIIAKIASDLAKLVVRVASKYGRRLSRNRKVATAASPKASAKASEAH